MSFIHPLNWWVYRGPSASDSEGAPWKTKSSNTHSDTHRNNGMKTMLSWSKPKSAHADRRLSTHNWPRPLFPNSTCPHRQSPQLKFDEKQQEGIQHTTTRSSTTNILYPQANFSYYWTLSCAALSRRIWYSLGTATPSLGTTILRGRENCFAPYRLFLELLCQGASHNTFTVNRFGKGEERLPNNLNERRDRWEGKVYERNDVGLVEA